MNRKERYELFKNVYDHNLWGHHKDGRRYYSDSPPELTAPYREYVSNFIRDHNIRRIVDIGCGDFEASSGLDMLDAHYIGVDLYDELIRYNNEHYANKTREFIARDVVEDDDLPDGDLCLVTMVLYLMSFKDAIKVLSKLRRYHYVLITDGQADIPIAERKNIDKPTDKYTRRDYYNNGFYLELPPFNLSLEVVSEYSLPSNEIIRTILLQHPQDLPD